eukprot:4330595-Amphidinium_carterae.1
MTECFGSQAASVGYTCTHCTQPDRLSAITVVCFTMIAHARKFWERMQGQQLPQYRPGLHQS